MTLIGLELQACIHIYLEDYNIHAEAMLLISMTAITRKIVILDATKTEPLVLIGIGVLVVALSSGYYLVKRVKDIWVEDNT